MNPIHLEIHSARVEKTQMHDQRAKGMASAHLCQASSQPPCAEQGEPVKSERPAPAMVTSLIFMVSVFERPACQGPNSSCT